MARRLRGKSATRSYSVAEELKRIQEINGKKRSVIVAVEDVTYRKGNDIKSTAEYGPEVNEDPRYNFSKGSGNIDKKIRFNTKIKRSIRKIGKVKRRTKKELDDISIEMGKEVIDDISFWVLTGMNRVYQKWKGTDSLNLKDTFHLVDAIVCIVKDSKGREIWRGK